jgi:hypothetical protein
MPSGLCRGGLDALPYRMWRPDVLAGEQYLPQTAALRLGMACPGHAAIRSA